MDRYEFDIKMEQIKKLMKKKDFATAVKIADGIDWKKVKETPLLIMAADVYEISGKYDEAREVLLLAYEKQEEIIHIGSLELGLWLHLPYR